ncbi:O-methyltransferase-domain-containing protein [Aspergillus pseudodeflectus]|uniref:O-methyltransferase-domain-containing protein n=1 Tax=Aspergillus pseudodeflectus TaxID=176178 RepID=A0ABR4L588_9EURO
MQITTDTNEYVRSIQQALQLLTAATEQCQLTYIGSTSDNVHSLGTREASRRALVLEAYRFVQTAQGPIDAAATCYEQTAHLATIRALLEMGVFEELPNDGTPRSADDLAARLGVDQSLLTRLLRHASLYGPLERTGEDAYRHTPFSLVYLRPEIRGMFRFAMNEHMPAHLKLHEFLTLNSWKTPDSTSNNPYTHAHQTNGKTMFANISTKPDRLKAFNDGMTVQAMTAIWMIDLFPFHKTFSASDPRPTTVLAVDIGGGRGRAIARIRDLSGDVRGRFILQDQAHVIAGLERGIPSTSYLYGIETVAHDFFTEQPVRGALVYLIRRCLHNWPEDSVLQILKHTAAAMEPGHSRLLIEEIIVPVRDSGIEEGWMDLIMMSLGAKQRTLEEWRAVLTKSGLALTNVYQVEGYCHGLIEARVVS